MTKKILIFTSFIFITSACLITNCPRGGKRGDIEVPESIRECLPCGPNQLGQCFGPKICCGPTFGCHIGTSQTQKCRKEQFDTSPCLAGFSMCNGNKGRCGAAGICCSQNSCFIDPSCRFPTFDDWPGRQKIDSDLKTIASEILKEEAM
ncbi:PREDICTED: oxytocin-neurophysin 1-like [Polistes dominula]|uniref:Oxytocin-neurophysin 1-like n=1 Tax=Polistes dominula TaxID=743375 RepID=A0ABM1I9N5_POLDO|nr:PREDICTED: oxytocin-neurophysin 1-like [Polistes dominula]